MLSFQSRCCGANKGDIVQLALWIVDSRVLTSIRSTQYVMRVQRKPRGVLSYASVRLLGYSYHAVLKKSIQKMKEQERSANQSTIAKTLNYFQNIHPGGAAQPLSSR